MSDIVMWVPFVWDLESAIVQQGCQPPLLAAHDYGGAEGDILRRGGVFFNTPPDDDAFSELNYALCFEVLLTGADGWGC